MAGVFQLPSRRMTYSVDGCSHYKIIGVAGTRPEDFGHSLLDAQSRGISLSDISPTETINSLAANFDFYPDGFI